MMDDCLQDAVEVAPSTVDEELQERLLSETDVEELKKIINLFNLNIKKKDILRADKLSQLQDNIVNEMITRVMETPSLISNDSLVNIYKAVQGTIDKSDRSLDSIDVAAIQINQQQINVNVGDETGLDTGSKLKIADAIKAILNRVNIENKEIIESSESDAT